MQASVSSSRMYAHVLTHGSGGRGERGGGEGEDDDDDVFNFSCGTP